ncbi:hypothetical protein SAPIO_CDS1039 [Scedosporium apiospermum]|uniref:HPt domain-containing protein n=1 Tax=Pseudallescheria apiosperma TaxID=563466 RepID=A0A084GFQ5_PSEDA|nr:uncharacterized protein SAPIO_CDS1039 [Scedosporium apiospermum]KEZ46167.1 hypothetical protein SAPIO_CDS1039 [Scedosporium apiospermum]
MAASENELRTFFGDLSKSIDIPTFDQILQMDDDQEREFSRTLVFEFLEQAEDTFGRIQKSLDEQDLPDLSSKGHYLKGSSATLGLIKIRDSCEKIQRYGLKENVDGTPEPDEELCLKRIKNTLTELRDDFDEIAKALKRFYRADEEDGEEDDSEEEDDEEEDKAEESKNDKAQEPASTEGAKTAGDAEQDTKKGNGPKASADAAAATDKEDTAKEAGAR